MLIAKTVQSITHKYSIECKAKFEELSKIILKLNLCRKELREYDRQFKSSSYTTYGNNNTNNTNSTIINSNNNGVSSSINASQSTSRKNSSAPLSNDLRQLNRVQSHLSTLAKLQRTKVMCFGCSTAALEHCLTLFRVFLCSAYIQQQPSLLQHVKVELCRNNILEDFINLG